MEQLDSRVELRLQRVRAWRNRAWLPLRCPPGDAIFSVFFELYTTDPEGFLLMNDE